MRIAIVRREPGVSISMDVYADGLIRGLRAVRPNWEIVELTPPTSSRKANPLLGGVQKYYQRYWRYPNIARTQAVDTFHVIDHSDGHLTYRLKHAKQPILVTCHDLINFEQPENIGDQAKLPWLSTAIWQYAVRGICQADHIISVSNYTAKEITRLLKVEPQNITVVPNAVESVFRPLPTELIATVRQQYSISDDQFYLLNVGSNHPRKNVSTVLQVVKTLYERGTPVHLLKAGADFTLAQKEWIVAQQLQPWITYIGKPSREILVHLYNAAHLLIAPSLSEGFGMTILEAMACGTPVVTSNVTSLPEVAGNAAVLTAPQDIEAIANAIHFIRMNPFYREALVERGLTRVKTFTWENTAEQIATLHERFVQSKLGATW